MEKITDLRTDERKKIVLSRYLAAFAFSILFILLGYLVGIKTSGDKLDVLSYMEQDIRVQSLSNEIVYQLVEADVCNQIKMETYTKELTEIGKKLTYLESLYGYDSEEVVHLKNYYSLLQIRHWMLSEEVNKKCGYNTSLVLFFYTNYDCNDCNDQGLVLSNVHTTYPFFYTYSFGYTLNNSAIEYLTSIYGINDKQLPALIIDGKTYYGFQSKEILTKLLRFE